MKNALFVLLFLLPAAFAFAPVEKPLDGSCDAPANVHITSQSSSSISFDWDDASGATGYSVWYAKQGGGSSSTYSESNSNHTYGNLTTGTYDFFFQTICDGEVSEIIVVEDIFIG